MTPFPWSDVLIIAGLILLNGLFSMSELAIVSARPSRLRVAADKGSGGAKVALAVLSTLSPSELANAIALKDIAMVARAPGVGKKVAERIVTELKNKAPAFAGEAAGTIGLKQELGEGVAAAPVADAVSALTNLGYSRDMAANAIAAALKEAGDGADSARLIRLGLKELAR